MEIIGGIGVEDIDDLNGNDPTIIILNQDRNVGIPISQGLLACAIAGHLAGFGISLPVGKDSLEEYVIALRKAEGAL